MKVYCPDCDQKRDVSIITEPTFAEARGVSFTYDRKRVYCAFCGAEVYSQQINDSNIKARVEGYMEARK